jgi:poly(A) polymerase
MDPYVDSILRFARADLTTSFDDKRQAALDNLDELASRIEALEQRRELRPDLPSGLGNDIMQAFELEPSPMVGELKDHLEEQIMDGQLENHRDSRYYVKQLTSNPPDFLREALDDA